MMTNKRTKKQVKKQLKKQNWTLYKREFLFGVCCGILCYSFCLFTNAKLFLFSNTMDVVEFLIKAVSFAIGVLLVAYGIDHRNIEA